MKLRTKSILSLGAGLTLAAGIALPAFASGLVNMTGAPSIPAGQVVDGSAYLAGSTVTVQGTINGDLYCGANNVIITGTIEGDVICGANPMTTTVSFALELTEPLPAASVPTLSSVPTSHGWPPPPG